MADGSVWGERYLGHWCEVCAEDVEWEVRASRPGDRDRRTYLCGSCFDRLTQRLEGQKSLQDWRTTEKTWVLMKALGEEPPEGVR